MIFANLLRHETFSPHNIQLEKVANSDQNLSFKMRNEGNHKCILNIHKKHLQFDIASSAMHCHVKFCQLIWARLLTTLEWCDFLPVWLLNVTLKD